MADHLHQQDAGNLSAGYRISREQGSSAKLEEEHDASAARAEKRQSASLAATAAAAMLPAERTDSTYRETLEMKQLEREKLELLQQQQQQPAVARPRVSRWDRAPAAAMSTAETMPQEVAAPERKKSRWDQTPGMVVNTQQQQQELPPSASLAVGRPAALTRQQFHERPLTDEDLDAMLPSEGYEIVPVPPQYQEQVDSKAKKMDLFAPPEADGAAAMANSTLTSKEAYGVALADQKPILALDAQKHGADLPAIKPEDMHYFGKLLEPVVPGEMSKEEENVRHIMLLLLKIKNGLPAVRKQALRQITEEAPRLGAGPLFNQILPLLMSPTLDEQERHLLVKVVDRVLFRLEDLVRPFAHKIFSIIAPLLIETDHYARLEGREIISNLAKACGLATMIATMRPDIDNPDEFVRNTTARALAIVASALGIQAMCPFLRAVCRSKKSWEARHTGAKVVQQISALVGSGVLPHLNSLVDCVAPGLKDEQQKIRTMTALALSSLAEAAHPYGFESFLPILDALWDGISKHRGKGLAAFIKCEAGIIALMDEENANASVQRLAPVLVREFDTQDEETKKIILKATKQCALALGVTPLFIRETILPGFLPAFWTRRNALDRKNCEAVIDCTCALASKVGAAPLLERLVDHLRDEAEPMRRMAAECMERMLRQPGALADVSARLEERLVDGALSAFQEQTAMDDASQQIILRALIRIIESLGTRAKSYLAQICAVAKWRLANKTPQVRLQAADLMGGMAQTLKFCNEQVLMGHLGLVLYENLGEEYPEVLGSILGALRQIVVHLGCEEMSPPIRDLLPRLTPILKNSNEKVAENLIDLIGRIADGGASQVAAREWMRICFDMLEILRSPKMSIRRAAVNTFGFIARAVGPQDVLHTLLTNLRVQERQMRVCTTVAIAIVAESCLPFTVLPGLMNEYRTPDINVQNGVLKALSFMLQYVGDMAVDYVNAIAPLLQSALADRDHVHRQTACDAVKHLALGVAGRGCEDCLVHLLNFVFPNIFEQSPHVARAVLECVEALRIPLGAGRMLLYLLPGLFHPARQVRQVYWRLYNNLYVGDCDALVAYYPRFEQVPSLAAASAVGEVDAARAPTTSSSSAATYRRSSYHEMFV